MAERNRRYVAGGVVMKAFTLIEIIITLCIISLLFAVAVLNFIEAREATLINQLTKTAVLTDKEARGLLEELDWDLDKVLDGIRNGTIRRVAKMELQKEEALLPAPKPDDITVYRDEKHKEDEIRVEQEPIGFGLKAVKLTFVYDEGMGTSDKLEQELAENEDIESVETVDVRRAIG